MVSPAAHAGLTTAEAEARLAQFGSNELSRTPRASTWREFLDAFASPLILLLIAASVLSAYSGEVLDTALILSIVIIGATITFVQTNRSRVAAEKLKRSIAVTATVRRDGEWREILHRDVVPGDVIRLSAGDLVPADATLLEARDLHAQESALTGESLPAEKAVGGAPAGRVFLGTSIVSGTATAEVTATGSRTEFGQVVTRLNAAPPETAFQRGLREFSYLILRTTLALVIFVFAVRVYFHEDIFQSILFAVALAVGLAPEFLPMITSLTLAKGALRMASEGVIVRNLAAIQDLGSMDILCSDKTGTLTEGTITLELPPDPPARLLELAYWNSSLQTGVRSPLDAAILRQIAPPALIAQSVDEIPFDFERRRLSVVVEVAGERWLVTKGAPESVLSRCTAFAPPLTRETAVRVHEEQASQGKRVLAVAERRVDAAPRYSADDETGLTLVGFLAFTDPMRPETPAVIEELRASGVHIKLLTGDSGLVAAHLCDQIGLPGAGLLTGDQLEALNDVELRQAAEAHTVFARLSPSQKTRLLLALKQNGHVVGFMGDGINDSPSIRSADVGISVSTAVDVAREAASIVLTNPGLSVLLAGVREGRRAYGNMLKYLLMSTSSNFGNMFSMAAASLALPFLPMTPTQLLLNNFLYDLAQVAIPSDNVDRVLLDRPHRWDLSVVRRFMIGVGPVSSLFDFLTFFVLLHFFHAGPELFRTGWFVESLATQTLVLLVIRTLENPLRSRPSPALLASTLAIAALALILPYSPVAPYLGFVPLPPAYLLVVAGITLVYLTLVEFVKRRLVRSRLLDLRTAP